jgi:hypothetical protein
VKLSRQTLNLLQFISKSVWQIQASLAKSSWKRLGAMQRYTLTIRAIVKCTNNVDIVECWQTYLVFAAY